MTYQSFKDGKSDTAARTEGRGKDEEKEWKDRKVSGHHSGDMVDGLASITRELNLETGGGPGRDRSENGEEGHSGTRAHGGGKTEENHDSQKPRTVPSEKDEVDFISALNGSVFNEGSLDRGDQFPLRLRIETSDDRQPTLNEILKRHDVRVSAAQEEVVFSNKRQADAVVSEVLASGFKVLFNYSGFISHPGNLFIKNLCEELIDYDKLFDFFQSKSKYKSLADINIFNSAEDDVFAILKFENYLDVDHILDTLDVNDNPFHHNDTVPLYLNKYISKKERKLKYDDNSVLSDHVNSYNTIVIENLGDFLNEYNPTIGLLETFLLKFELFNKIDNLYFPVFQVDDNNFRLMKYGFINFEANENLNVNVLKCIYYLNDLNFEKFMNFTHDDVLNDEGELLKTTQSPLNDRGLKISIGQHKHNHYLYEFQTNQLLYLNQHKLCLGFLDLTVHNNIINSFSKFVNFQETNIYVNNFPIIFENNDTLWEKFWYQFGNSIKSAKIIKPQFYSKKNDELGKIGFVFYTDFKMALRAILLTNNRLINFKNFKNILIQTSFAIQKNNHGYQRPSLGTNYYPVQPPQNNYMKRFSMPSLNDYSYFMQGPPMASIAPTPSSTSSSDYFPMYNPMMYGYNYRYTSADKDHTNDGPLDRPGFSTSPPLNYYFQPYIPFAPSGTYQTVYSPPTPPILKSSKKSDVSKSK